MTTERTKSATAKQSTRTTSKNPDNSADPRKHPPDNTDGGEQAQSADHPTKSRANDQHGPSVSAEALKEALSNLQQEELEAIDPETAIDLYLSDRRQELRESSLASHRSALNFFGDWCDQNGVTNLNNLNGRQLQEYRVWRREEAPVKTDTLSKESEKTQQDILRQFIKYCESISAVKSGLHEKVLSPTVTSEEASRTDTLGDDRASDILHWLNKFVYASLVHVVWELITDTGLRIGTLVALDLGDYCPDGDPPHLRIRHRESTPLKNGNSAERLVALSPSVCTVLDDYIANQRPDVTDDEDREPLLATRFGRISRNTIRQYTYRYSRPCEIGKDCPVGRDVEFCEATTNNHASKCPSSRSPHALRRSYITHELAAGVDGSFISGRCNVSESVISTHYDVRDEQTRLEARHRALRAARQSDKPYGGE